MKTLLFIAFLCNSIPQGVGQLAIAYGGGGLRSVSADTAFHSSLLAADLKKKGKKKGTHAESGIMKNVDILTGTSGGSWYMANMVYSRKFVDMVESITESILSNQIKKTDLSFNGVYCKKMLDAAKNSKGKGLPVSWLLARLLRKLRIVSSDVSIFVNFMSALYEKGDDSFGTWSDITRYVLLDDIPSDATFAYQAQQWAEDKKLVITTAVSMPFKGQSGEFLWFDRKGLGRQSLKYHTVQKSKKKYVRHEQVPVRFSYTVGHNSEKMPVPYASNMLDDFEIRYEGKTCSGWFCSWWKKKKLKGRYSGKLIPEEENFANMPLSGILSASSAALGNVGTINSVAGIFAEVVNLLGFYPAVTFSPVLKGKDAFKVPEKRNERLWTEDKLTKKDVDDVKKNGVYALVDGGAGDVEGIVAAIAAGAKTIFALTGDNSWKCHFEINNKKCGMVRSLMYFPIFEGKAPSTANFKTLKHSRKKKSFITYGSFSATTIHSDDFGIEQGKSVKIHVLGMSGDVTAFHFEDFTNYGSFARNLIHVLTSPNNESIMNEILEVFSKDHKIQ